VTPEKFSFEILSSRILADRGMLKAEITFSKPIKELNFDSIFFLIDSLNILRFEQSNFSYDMLSKKITIQKNFDSKIYIKEETAFGDTPLKDTAQIKSPPPKQLNQLYLGKGAFIGVEQDSSTYTKIKINPDRLEDLGVIIVQTFFQNEKTIIQLTDRTNSVIAEVKHSDKATFNDLPPSDYHLRIIFDTNGNGKWDPGNYLAKEEPEDILYYSTESGEKNIKLKANFEIGPLLITY
jgi:hypothetical protein